LKASSLKNQDGNTSKKSRFTQTCWKQSLVFSELYHVPRQFHLISACRKDIWNGFVLFKTGMYNKSIGLELNLQEEYSDVTVYCINVHLPLSLGRGQLMVGAGKERIESSMSVAKRCKLFDHVIISGDFNCIQRVKGKEQLDCFSDYKVHTSDILNNDQTECKYKSTFYGGPQEKEDFQGFNTCDILDRVVTSGCTLLENNCIHYTNEEDEHISDHGTLVLKIEVPHQV
jgi:endonuclease/exonuclease/phosphatase family metal-dependent hydrolase